MTYKSIYTFNNKKAIAITALVLLLVVCGLLFYFIVIKNEGFSGSSSSTPNLTPDPSECVVALFYADWCPHCVTFKPIFQKAKEMMEKKSCTAPSQKGKKLRFEKVDSEAYPALAKQYSVNGFPTIKLITTSGVTEYSSGRDLDSMNNYFFPN